MGGKPRDILCWGHNTLWSGSFARKEPVGVPGGSKERRQHGKYRIVGTMNLLRERRFLILCQI